MDRILKSARTTGSLNLSSRSLREVPNEVYKSLDAVGEDEKWWEAVELQKLILAHNNLEVLKEDLKNLTSLSVLNISYNKLSSLPSAIGELAMLKSLDVSYNSITSIPEEIGSATSLVKFDCSNNLLKELPCSLGGCKDLSDLKASNNSLGGLPHGLASCSKLMKLDVEGNKLTMMSEDVIASWTVLTELNAAKNLLLSIPDNIGVLSRLIRLDFHQNRISSIPPSIKGCSSLTEFFMGTNLLLSVPQELGELSHLGALDLHSNQLKEFPVEACKLHLSVLDLSNNSLSGLPPELGKMTTLRKLLLTGNPLRTLRSSLVSGPTPALLKYLRSRLSSDEEASGSSTTPMKEDLVAAASRVSLSSKELSLSGLGLSSIPVAVWETDEIVKVDLSRNAIEELASELSSCLSLQVECPLTKPKNVIQKARRSLCMIPQDMEHDPSSCCRHYFLPKTLKPLLELILSGNKIKDWPGAVLASLSNLSCLRIDNNPLRQIPPNGFEALLKLQILDLSGNALSYPEPPAFSCLHHLQELYLRRMQLREVPSDLLVLRQLKILDLTQNSLVSVPKELKDFTSLTELVLSDNNITTLPAELGLLESNLQVLKLDGNPLRSIRRPILDRGTKAVLKYLKDKLPEP